jgi:hypothetical protein
MKSKNENEAGNPKEESTYSLLERSDEKKRGLVEIVVYALIVLCVVAAIFQFADEFMWFHW